MKFKKQFYYHYIKVSDLEKSFFVWMNGTLNCAIRIEFLQFSFIFLHDFRSTDDFNGAQCKAVCVEAGMIALRREATTVHHEDFMDAILEVQAKKKATLNYYAQKQTQSQFQSKISSPQRKVCSRLRLFVNLHVTPINVILFQTSRSSSIFYTRIVV